MPAATVMFVIVRAVVILFVVVILVMVAMVVVIVVVVAGSIWCVCSCCNRWPAGAAFGPIEFMWVPRCFHCPRSNFQKVSQCNIKVRVTEVKGQIKRDQIQVSYSDNDNELKDPLGWARGGVGVELPPRRTKFLPGPNGDLSRFRLLARTIGGSFRAERPDHIRGGLTCISLPDLRLINWLTLMSLAWSHSCSDSMGRRPVQVVYSPELACELAFDNQLATLSGMAQVSVIRFVKLAAAPPWTVL